MSVAAILDLQLKSESVETFHNWLKENLAETRAFVGCQSLIAYSNKENPTNVIIYEIWDSVEHHQKYVAWREENGSLATFAENLAAPPNIRYLDPLDV